MAGGPLSTQKAEAARRGWIAVVGWALTPILVVKAGWILGLVAAGVAVWLTSRWFKYRAEWGMRF
ncbi:MAG: hypothetical protein EXR79_14725 [Myxococcales bacterium]|nr:hypothetical protein [Myxococcales bacterium]